MLILKFEIFGFIILAADFSNHAAEILSRNISSKIRFAQKRRLADYFSVKACRENCIAHAVIILFDNHNGTNALFHQMAVTEPILKKELNDHR
jgi:hypothetical protein